MKERILDIINYFNLSSSQFANEIGIQRSAVSHILSGRNKPSLELVLKILNRFPEISTDWLILGEGKMIKNEKDNNVPEEDKIQGETGLFDWVDTENSSMDNEVKEENKIEMKKPSSEITTTEDGSVEKIIFFYTNGKFKIYRP